MKETFGIEPSLSDLRAMDRSQMGERLGERARVARRAVWLPLGEDGRWRTTLVAVLQAMGEGLA